MMYKIKAVVIILVISVLSPFVKAQPSSSMYLTFSLKDKNGRIQDLDLVKANWKVIGMDGAISFDRDTAKTFYLYNDTSKYFSMPLNEIYSPFVLSFVTSKDTMTFYFKTDHCKVTIPNLRLRPGKYTIYTCKPPIGKVHITTCNCLIDKLKWGLWSRNYRRLPYSKQPREHF